VLALDVGPGAGSGMSLEGVHDVHFALSSTPAAELVERPPVDLDRACVGDVEGAEQV